MLTTTNRFLATAIIVFVAPLARAQQSEFRTLAASLAKDIQGSGKRSIAVVDFTDLQGNPTELGRYLAEEFSVALTRNRNGFEVIDRTHLKTILAENKLASTGLIDPSTAKRLGQIVGADAIVTGSMTPFSESVRLTVKVLSTDTARIVTADATDLPKTTTIAQLLGNSLASGQSERGSPVTSSARSSSSANRPPSSPVIVESQFQFELQECKGIANSVTCSFRVTNRGPDRDFILACGSVIEGTRAFDNSGNESFAETCTIANRDSNSGLAAGLTVTARLISGVPVPVTTLFQNLAASASSISLVTLVGTSDRSPDFNVSFRNVPILR